MGTRVGWDIALASLLLSFATSMIIATVYTITYHGIGYLRSFVQTIALGGLVASLVMLAIGDDVARGLGMVGALTLIRFRTTLKDTRDLIFMFASLGIGVACGVQAFAAALLGTAMFSLAAMDLSWSDFGSRLQFDIMLRFQGPADAELVNKFNSEYRFASAYYDEESDICVQSDLDFEGGATLGALKQFIKTFASLLEDYSSLK